MTVKLHDDELAIDVSLVRRLVDHQFPQYAALELQPLTASGSSNVLFRLGDDLLVRLPRQPGGSAGIEKEARWLPFVASRLSISVPTVLAIGEPDEGYPEHWSLVAWQDGHPPAVVTAGAEGTEDRRRLGQRRERPRPERPGTAQQRADAGTTVTCWPRTCSRPKAG